MTLIQFNDTCVVTRAKRNAQGTAIFDENGNIQAEVIYRGACNYQPTQTMENQIMTKTADVYLPSNDVLLYSGDMFEVTTARGRMIKGVVGEVRDCEMPMSHELLTFAELKQVVE